jgi:phosphoserine phosphatase
VNCPTHYFTENKTIVFDIDSTLIDAEAIDKLSRAAKTVVGIDFILSICQRCN